MLDKKQALPKGDSGKGTVAYEAVKRIAAIYHEDNELANLTPEERIKLRQATVRPLVEAFFVWIKEIREKNALSSGQTLKGIKYCINQETFLKVFLEYGEVPLDNNATEGALRSFYLHKHAWKLIDSIDGARSSAIIYSIAETGDLQKQNRQVKPSRQMAAKK